MRTSDFMIRSLFAMFLLVIAVILTMAIMNTCSSSKILSTPKQIIKRERVSESGDKEIWCTSTYKLHTVEYDTVMKKRSWDTAHELPR